MMLTPGKSILSKKIQTFKFLTSYYVNLVLLNYLKTRDVFPVDNSNLPARLNACRKFYVFLTQGGFCKTEGFRDSSQITQGQGSAAWFGFFPYTMEQVFNTIPP